jgi:hypothetical protein
VFATLPNLEHGGLNKQEVCLLKSLSSAAALCLLACNISCQRLGHDALLECNTYFSLFLVSHRLPPIPLTRL